jgi:prefoldin beta subunit
MKELTQEQKTMVAQFQLYQQQMQNVMLQKESMRIQQMEVDRALQELKNTKQASAYKITGNIMISKPDDELRKELDEAKEEIGVRLKSIEATESKFNDKLKELQEKLNAIIQ